MSELLSTILLPFELLVVVYSLSYLACNAFLIFAAFRPVLDEVRGLGFADLDEMDDVVSTIPSIAIIVPAFNEETTLVESVRSLMQVDYPQIEIVVVNDGSTDRTMEFLRDAFALQRRDVAQRSEIATATVRAVYEAGGELPSRLVRFLVVDKENGGRSDALNAGINLCISPFVLLVDADCVVDPQALKQVVRLLQVDPEIVTIGGQIGVINDCLVDHGRVVRKNIPRGYWPLCQTLEYVRAFSLMRTGFSRFNSLTIVSGAFMVMTRQIVIEVGGFLTGRSPSRLLEEFVGPGRHTICEDMEIVVRIHRYLRQRGLPGKVVHTPVPLVWTEVPPGPSSLGRQRRRWHRGFLEILSYHRRMILNPDYGRVGLLALPYLVWFELLGPYIESLGLILFPLLALVGLLDPVPAMLMVAIALGCGVLQSLLAVLGASWMERTSPGGSRLQSLIGADRWQDRLLLLAACFLGELGYRQMTLVWRLHGTWDFLRGKTGWDKFARAGFKSTAAALAVLFVTAAPVAHAVDRAERSPDANAERTRSAVMVVGSERREDRQASWWLELTNKWSEGRRRQIWFGLSHQERDVRADETIILGVGGSPGPRIGFGTELRITPGATFLPDWSFFGESEFALGGPFTGSAQLRSSRYAELWSTTYAAGVVFYGPLDSWIAVRALLIDSHFDEVGHDRLLGWMTHGSLQLGRVELRLDGQSAGESYIPARPTGLDEIRAVSMGGEIRVPVTERWRVLAGLHQRWPERGVGNLYLHGGVHHDW